MFRQIISVSPLPDYRLCVQFAEDRKKIYDMKPLVERIPSFAKLKDMRLFTNVTVDVGGHGIIWDDDLDISCNELWDNGIDINRV